MVYGGYAAVMFCVRFEGLGVIALVFGCDWFDCSLR